MSIKEKLMRKRYTDRNQNSINGKYVLKGNVWAADATQKLGAYEDSGLIPDEVVCLKESHEQLNKKISWLKDNHSDVYLDMLAHFLSDEQDTINRLIDLPNQFHPVKTSEEDKQMKTDCIYYVVCGINNEGDELLIGSGDCGYPHTTPEFNFYLSYKNKAEAERYVELLKQHPKMVTDLHIELDTITIREVHVHIN